MRRALTDEVPGGTLRTLYEHDALFVRVPRELVRGSLSTIRHGAGEGDAQSPVHLAERCSVCRGQLQQFLLRGLREAVYPRRLLDGFGRAGWVVDASRTRRGAGCPQSYSGRQRSGPALAWRCVRTRRAVMLAASYGQGSRRRSHCPQWWACIFGPGDERCCRPHGIYAASVCRAEQRRRPKCRAGSNRGEQQGVCIAGDNAG